MLHSVNPVNKKETVILFFLLVIYKSFAVISFPNLSESFEDNCQETSVPHLLLALVSSMVLEGPSIKDQSRECSKQAALSITQLMKYNYVKHMHQHREQSSCSTQESPLAILG